MTRAAWERYFKYVDVFLCPTNFTPAFPHDDRPFDQRTVLTPEGERPYDDRRSGYLTHPCPGSRPSSDRSGLGKGLPVGMQIIGPLFEDDTAITFAELAANVVGGYEPPPSEVTDHVRGPDHVRSSTVPAWIDLRGRPPEGADHLREMELSAPPEP